MRHASKKSVFRVLRNLRISVVIDIGAERCTESLIEAFPDAHHVLIESNPTWIPLHKDVYSEISFESHNFAASSQNRVDELKFSDCGGPVLLKIDVDGQELDCLHGCSGLLERVSAVVVEATTDRLSGIVDFLERHNFRLFDIVDLCYCGPQLHQVDLVFVHASAEGHVRVAWDINLFQDSSLLATD
jgi:hypothetical protein